MYIFLEKQVKNLRFKHKVFPECYIGVSDRWAVDTFFFSRFVVSNQRFPIPFFIRAPPTHCPVVHVLMNFLHIYIIILPKYYKTLYLSRCPRGRLAYPKGWETLSYYSPEVVGVRFGQSVAAVYRFFPTCSCSRKIIVTNNNCHIVSRATLAICWNPQQYTVSHQMKAVFTTRPRSPSS